MTADEGERGGEIIGDPVGREVLQKRELARRFGVEGATANRRSGAEDGGRRALEERVRAEFGKSNAGSPAVTFTHMVRMQYYGQLVDIEVDSPGPELTTAADAQALCDAFPSPPGWTRTAATPFSSPIPAIRSISTGR